MCGIFGYYNTKYHPLKEELLNQMGQRIAHRGPDDTGIHQARGCAIGNRRLSIIDIEGGHQPFVSDDGRITVVQNGEIYNHVELAEQLARSGYPCRSKSDTEVLLRLYERDGIDFVNQLNGMFAIAIYDDREDCLYLIRDRIGVKPLFFYFDGEQFVFSSEIKSILASGVTPELNEEGLDQYLAYNFVPPPITMFKGIYHIMPGHVAKVTRQGMETRKWWDLSEIQCEQRSESEWVERFNEVLDDAVRIRLRADVPFGAFLSGGIDSSSVVGTMARHMNQPVRTFSIGFEDPRYDESPYAKMAAERFGTLHTSEIVHPNMLDLWPTATYYCDQPHGDVSFMPTYRVSQLAVKQVKMVLTGDGADELFAGYDKYKTFFSNPNMNDATAIDNATFQREYITNIGLFSESSKSNLYTDEFKRKVSPGTAAELAHQLFGECEHMDRINQALFLDMKLLLPGNNLVKPDRMGMAVSLEARTPFLDYRMMELAFRIPGNLKLKKGETKYIYKKAVLPLLGEQLVYREKQMFTVPIGEWFKSELSGFVRDKLLQGQLVSRSIVKQEALVNMIEQHIKGEANYTREIRALISLEYWFESFLS